MSVTYTDQPLLASRFQLELDSFAVELALNPVQGGSYLGDGNELIWSAVPEPSAYAALLGCMALVVAISRRRRG